MASIACDAAISTRRWPRLATIAISCLSVLLSVWLCGRLALHDMYTGFQTYDDEGAMLITLEQMNRGHPLYDQVVTMYGPIGFLPKLALIKLFGLTIDHDTGRAISLGIWLLTSVISGAVVWRITGLAPWFAVGMSAVCFILIATANEPGHPQDLCSLWIAGCLFASTFVTQRRFISLSLMAILAACLALTKINLGIFCVVATAVAIVVHLPHGIYKRVLFTVLSIGLLAIPVMLMHGGFNHPPVVYLCIEIVLSMVACLCFASIFPASSQFCVRDLCIWIGSFVTSVVLGCLITISTNVSIKGLLEGVILLPLRLSHAFSLMLPVQSSAVIRGVIGVLFAICIGSWFRLSTENVRRTRIISVIRVVAAICALAMLCPQDLLDLFLWTPPLAWLVMMPTSSNDGKDRFQFARVFLAFLSVTELMWAYPVAGSQVAFALFPMIILAVITLADGVYGLAALANSASKTATVEWSVSGVVVVCVLCFDAIVSGELVELYKEYVPLRLPGSSYIHVSQQQASDYEDIVATLRLNADALITLPGLNSFYFWTHLAPPTSANVTGWTYILTDQQEREIVDALKLHPNACMLFDAKELSFWLKDLTGPPKGPLMDYLHEQFSPVVDIGRCEILVRKDRQTVTVVRGASSHVFRQNVPGRWIPVSNH